jgi:hypothetical protein
MRLISIKALARNLRNFPGWRTSKKFIVFESDDWGSIRMPSINSFNKLEGSGLDLRSASADRYNLNDTIESGQDLGLLFEVLSGFKDASGNSAVFTPITIVANPDFKKIFDSGFQNYFYEPFNVTLSKYYGNDNAFEIWKEGIERKLFLPQMHGREHLNVISWMKALRQNDSKTVRAFNEGFWGFVPDQYPAVDYQAAFLLASWEDLEYHKSVITDGLTLFKKLFGYKAEYFVPPNGQFNNSLNRTLSENGITLRSTTLIQSEPLGNGLKRKVYHYPGQKDDNGITYTIRNCVFEPCAFGMNWVDRCLSDINTAFRWHKPAIIGTHRVNYIGSLNPHNRDNGLRQLSLLLKSITRIWPEVEFITTPGLKELIRKKENFEQLS